MRGRPMGCRRRFTFFDWRLMKLPFVASAKGARGLCGVLWRQMLYIQMQSSTQRINVLHVVINHAPDLYVERRLCRHIGVSLIGRDLSAGGFLPFNTLVSPYRLE